MKWLALILGSVWLFPVSCAGGVAAGASIVAHLDKRDIANGDEAHPGFSIVAEPGNEGRTFRAIRLTDIHDGRETAVGRTLMSAPSGRIDTNSYTFIAYRILENTGASQVIEVQDQNDDRTIWSVYRVSADALSPLSSRMTYMGYMFTAFPFAFGGALVLYWIGLYLRRRSGIAPR
jgi:hypothetical protein